MVIKLGLGIRYSTNDAKGEGGHGQGWHEVGYHSSGSFYDGNLGYFECYRVGIKASIKIIQKLMLFIYGRCL
jgi:hypothetical protein